MLVKFVRKYNNIDKIEENLSSPTPSNFIKFCLLLKSKGLVMRYGWILKNPRTKPEYCPYPYLAPL